MHSKYIYILSAILFVALVSVGCLKDKTKPCVPNSVDSEMPAMKKFASDSAIETITDESGILYQIIQPGTGAAPTETSTITVKYTGRLLTGVLFDESQSGFSYPLQGLIKAWQIILPKVKTGGVVKMITPSIFAYSCQRDPRFSQVNNQPLYFHIELIEVK